MVTLVHVTHEAVQQTGGIGTVLRGLITAAGYQAYCERTILLGPLVDATSPELLGPDGEVLYDADRGVKTADLATRLSPVEVEFGVRLVYGRRLLQQDDRQAWAEVLLVDISRPPHGLNQFKYDLFQHFGLDSQRHEQHWEYEQYLRLSEPGLAGVRALVAEAPFFLLAHEFMGLGTAFKALLSGDTGCKTLFYAHEVATVRLLVEERPGRDIAFYNALRRARVEGTYIDDIFGPQDAYFKHALVRQAWRLDAVLAVGDAVVEELRFLGAEFAAREIDLVYNGVPAVELSPGEREGARQKLQESGASLLGWAPDLVFTHVTRLVKSKGLWRDLLVLEHLDRVLWERGQQALFVVLSTETGRRSPEEVRRMAEAYGWPLAHREGGGDLSRGELEFDLLLRAFNGRTRAVKGLFVNQFGWDRESCGEFLSADAEFADLRRGSDVEFGQSIYEPFGIAQVESLGFGSISVVSDVCGCVGFVEAAAGKEGLDAFVKGAYTQLGEMVDESGQIGAIESEWAEGVQSRVVAQALAGELPTDASGREKLLQEGYAAARAMSWERVAEDMLVPVLRRLVE